MKKLFCAAAFCTLASPIAAFATIYDCSFNPPNGSWASPEVVLSYDENSGEALVMDSVVKQFVGKPIPATITSQTPKKIVFSWKVMAKDVTGKSSTMAMRLAFFKETKKATLTAAALEYANNDAAHGTCKVE